MSDFSKQVSTVPKAAYNETLKLLHALTAL